MRNRLQHLSTTGRILLTVGVLAAVAAAVVALGVVVFTAPVQASANSELTAQKCFAADNSGDGVIDLTDLQRVAAAAWSYPGRSNWDPRLDVLPWLAPDGFVDIHDIQFVAGRFGFECYLTKNAESWFSVDSTDNYY